MTESKELFRQDPYYITAEYFYVKEVFCSLFINFEDKKIKETMVYKRESDWGEDIQHEFKLLVEEIHERILSKQQFENIINHIQQS